MRPALTAVALCLAIASVAASDRIIQFDEDVNFGRFRSFVLASPGVTSDREELRFPAVSAAIGAAVRQTLVARGLTEAATRPDLDVVVQITGVDYVVGPFGRPNITSAGRSRSGGGPLRVDFTEATLVVDLRQPVAGTLLWRGVFRDLRASAAELPGALAKGAIDLLSQYPPRRR